MPKVKKGRSKTANITAPPEKESPLINIAGLLLVAWMLLITIIYHFKQLERIGEVGK